MSDAAPLVLVIDDEDHVCRSLSEGLVAAFLEDGITARVEFLRHTTFGLARIRAEVPAAVITNIRRGEDTFDGLRILDAVRERSATAVVVVHSTMVCIPDIAKHIREHCGIPVEKVGGSVRACVDHVRRALSPTDVVLL